MVLPAFLVVAPTICIYFLILKGVDRYEPEPFWLLLLAFFWGAVVATSGALIGNEAGAFALRASLGAGREALVEATTASFVAPLVEESTKGAGLLVLWALSAFWVREIDGALDGAIYGGIIGLGFTMTEDVLYVASAGAHGGAGGFLRSYVLRTVFAGLSHASFSAMTGIGVGFAVESSRSATKLLAPLAGFCAAVSLHGIHNYLLTFLYADGFGVVAKLFIFWLFDALFFIVIVFFAVRDRMVVLRGLRDEAGRLLHPKELQRTVSFWMLVPLWNFYNLLASPRGYAASRRKQLALIELSFLKQRRRRGERGRRIEAREAELRARIHAANRDGVFIGAR